MHDILLALRLNTEDFDIDLPVSASIRAEVLADGTPQVVQGQLLTEKGTIVDRNNDKVTLTIDRADVRFNWDDQRRNLVIPFQVQSGGNQFTMRATLDAPAGATGHMADQSLRAAIRSLIRLFWLRGRSSDDEGVALNRVAMRLKVDTIASGSISSRVMSAESIRAPRTISASRSPAAWTMAARSRILPSALRARACLSMR